MNARFSLSLTIALVGPIVGCSFERRVPPVAEAETSIVADPTSAVTTSIDAEASAVMVVDRFRSAVTVGDLSLALSLLDRDAVLVDAELGEASAVANRGEFLLELRATHMDGMHFQPIRTEVTSNGDGTVTVFTLLAMLEENESGLGEEVGRSYETVVLVALGEDWRIRHLHRSPAPAR